MDTLFAGWHDLALSAAVAISALALGLLAAHLVLALLHRISTRTESILDDALLDHLRGPLLLAFPLMLFLLAAPSLRLPPQVVPVLGHLFSISLIAAIAWFLTRLTLALRDTFLNRYDFSATDNLRARAVHTQINIIVKIALVVIFLIAVSSALMTFEGIRQVGVSLLASAGIAGIIIGFAAQRSIATMFAGLQIALTQPIRLDDVLIVEGEWGRVEEITLTYVVVRIWDLRRLVLPITYFIEKPFQNWTRVSADILGTVFLYADYTIPVEKVRRKLHEILRATDLWDGKVWGLQVTNATERTVELRALMSAPDASLAWDLRCHVREALLAWLQGEFPASLPRVRAEIPGGSGKGAAGVNLEEEGR